MTNDFLTNILEHKRTVNQERNAYYEMLKDKLSSTEYSRYSVFKNKISQPDHINLIAEIKKASPSQGLLREDFDPLLIARTYSNNGAAAISVLTEDKFFLGKPAYIQKISLEVNVPLLTKDFIIDEGQIYEARHLGASAVLLIAAILPDAQLKQFLQLATSLDIDCLLEVHDEEELKRALDCGAEIIGINNRNLRTFEVDLKTSLNLIPKIPNDKVIVAESGIDSHEHIVALKEAGANAVLIGETFMREADIAAKMKEVMGTERGQPPLG